MLEKHDNEYFYFVESFSNYDGDSVNIIVSRTWDFGFEEKVIKRSPIKVRLYGVDTPELRGGTDVSKAAARLAKDFVSNWLQEVFDQNALFFESWEYKKGKFGRALGDFYNSITEERLSHTLLTQHLAVYYFGLSKDDIQLNHESNFELLKKEGLI